ncbi:E3 ubiquitin-protein ligase FANCL [Polistes fuscatus]|uniref:E3 ubiquitin-protein ligase FANCL n=1 Tax=Polistes fuscatus TaxID=30207 RepID=UPI001CA817BD|nr:E3 ubiquitin-protein ligase FANCL [Polistes fuscatus]XP_043494678.1 E3 ubiquitin-protein ligase FANCL [Polistes fuscatus]
MLIEECESIFQWHPEIILTSTSPVTWQGLLMITIPSNAIEKQKVRLKLILPNYPLIHGAVLNFGKSYAFLQKRTFITSVNDLIQKSSSVSSFLRLLQSLISETIDKLNEEYNVPIDQSPTAILQDLRYIFESKSGVTLSSNSSLDTIKLSLKNIHIVLKRTNDNINPWNVISNDLPEISALGSFNQKISSLTIIIDKFKQQVDRFDALWKVLSEIDKNCCILDPIPAKPNHLYRRIYLSQSLSILITIDPLNPTSPPNLKFLGSDVDVQRQKNIISKNMHIWNSEKSILHNLLILLDISEFPSQKEQSDSIDDQNCMFMNEECCICFSLESDTEQFPNKICDNIKCRRHFHTKCLLQWLQAVAGNQVAFDHIHGSCPHCEESISCPIN